MKLIINGQEQNFDAGFSLATLLDKLGMKQDRVAVELNREIVRRELWTETKLSDGDKLEIVHFVGGGAGEKNEGRAPDSRPDWVPRSGRDLSGDARQFSLWTQNGHWFWSQDIESGRG
jgi:thiamine biosynthesis protein ThiS